MTQIMVESHGAVFYTSIAALVLLYASTIWTVPQFMKFIHYALTNISSHDPFFHIRQPTISILYILCFMLVLYLLYPSVLILMNINIIHSTIPLYINDFGNILIFASFFSRAWVLILDRHFSDNLQNWFWRREVNAKESQSNKFIKYGALFRSYRRIIVLSLYILSIAPICATLMLFSYSHYIFLRAFTTIILSALLSITYYLIAHKVSMITDELLIRTELLCTLKSTSFFYVISGFLYIISVYTIHWRAAIIIEILCISMGHLCAIYWSCKWAIRQFEFMHIKYLRTNSDKMRRSFLHTFNKEQHIKFEDVMSHRAGIESFARHLADEFGLESILLIIEVSQYKATIHKRHETQLEAQHIVLPTAHTSVFPVDKILNIAWMPMDPRMLTYSPYKIALYLYDKYIEQSADLCINISSTNRRTIYKAFKELAQRLAHHESEEEIELDAFVVNVLYTLFDEALSEIWNLIQMDTFTRFRSSETFERLLRVLYPEKTKQILSECNKQHEEQSKNQKKVNNHKNVPQRNNLPIMNPYLPTLIDSISPDNDVDNGLEEKKELEDIQNIHTINTKQIIIDLPSIAVIEQQANSSRHNKRALSDVYINANTNKGTNGLNLPRPKLHLGAHSARYDDMKLDLEHSISSDVATLLSDVVVPSDIIKTAADFWRLNINTLHHSDKLEIGVAIYLSILAADRTVQKMFKNTNAIRQEQIELLSLKFLDMICWLIESLWSRNDHRLSSTLSKLGDVHKQINIEIKHFNVMLPVIHETLSFYFPVRYRLQEKFAMDYIFAYSTQIMMRQPLSTKTNSKTYYKTLELKFNSEKKKNDFLKNKNSTGLKLEHEISAPVENANPIVPKIKIKKGASFIGIHNLPSMKRDIMARLSPIAIHAQRTPLSLKNDKSNSLSMGLIHTISVDLV